MLYWIGHGCSERVISPKLEVITVLAKAEGKRFQRVILDFEIFCSSLIILDTGALLSFLDILTMHKQNTLQPD